MLRLLLIATMAVSVLTACGGDAVSADANASESTAAGSATSVAVTVPGNPPFEITALAAFNEPWAMEFMPDGRMLVTEKSGALFIVDAEGNKSTPIEGVPDVDYGGQGGLGDVVVHPDFASNNLIYLSYAEAGDGDTRGAAISRARLTLTSTGGRLEDSELVWRQVAKVPGRGHYGHRMVFSDDGFLWVSSGERQKFDPSQDMQSNMGKILRLNADGSVPEDNPFADQGGVTAQIWSLGHRNPLGIAFDLDGNLWNSEMGPRHGDELNFVREKANYGYPIVSNGDHYNGEQIPDHDTRPEFEAPAAYWVPSIAPSSLMIYSGEQFPEWRGDAFIGGLASQALIQVELDGTSAREIARYPMGKRIREVEQGPDGAIWLLEDQEGGRLLRLTPKQN
ncbi:MAG: PQQ-dependent sugar dehydrogenase [Pseudomonadota bacterium]